MPGAGPPPPASTANPRPFPLRRASSSDVKRDFHGKTRAQVLAKLGEPNRSAKFPMSMAVGEFRVELQNSYPLSDPANAEVEIEELIWRDGDYWIALWLHQVEGEWVVLDSCRWHKDIAF